MSEEYDDEFGEVRKYYCLFYIAWFSDWRLPYPDENC
jgi:hypothetical protein